MNRKVPLIELQYLPCLEYMAVFQKNKEVIIEAEENYIKQSYRNRSYLNGANKIEQLSIPVLGGNKKIKTKNILIDHKQKWVQQHWRTIQSSYGKAPFFEYYAVFFQKIFEKKYDKLWNLNLEILTLCLKLLDISTTIRFSDSYEKETEPEILDLRSVINPKKSYSLRDFYKPVPYNQIFGKEFVANLSVIDLLFCEGPSSSLILHESIK